MAIIIEYSKHGIPNADLESEWLAEQIYKRYVNYRSELDYTYQTSTDTLILAFRLLVAEGKIPHDIVSFKFNDEIIGILPDGQTARNYPNGFCDAEINMLFRLMKSRRNKE